jgi:DnaK suppressor protein
MDISKIQRQLMNRREQILNQRGKINDSWQQLQEQEVELEENAAKEKMAAVLAQLDDQEKHEIELIDRALAKIKASALGICESCGRQISERRLEAIPWAPLCIDCAETHQSGPSTASPNYEKNSVTAGNKEAQGYSDTQIQEMIEDQLLQDDRIEDQELHYYSKEGWIYLEGCLPSRSQHEILISMIQDVLGFKDIVDHIKIDRQLWEQQKYTRQSDEPGQSWKEEKMQGKAGETDVWVSREFGTSMEPPDKLGPEKK